MKIFIVCILSFFGLVIGLSYLGAFTNIATAPSRVINKTMQTDNIINNYEWYHDANAQYTSRIGQIKDYKKMVEAATGDQERARMNIDLSAVRQSCRDLATRYNANATKSNRSIFMGREAPESLSMMECDR